MDGMVAELESLGIIFTESIELLGTLAVGKLD
jgi:hypothetical protein